jgi:adenine-specific DNA-methyltransferase
MLQAWLRENPIGIEDGLRHDKWCAMMWPRLKLLHELLGETGSLWMTLDDNEVHRARAMLDEIFGESRFVGIFVVVNNLKGRNDKENLALTHEYMLVYSKDEYLSRGLELSDEQLAEFKYQDGDGPKYALRDLRKRGSEDRKEDRRNMHFPIYWNKQSGVLALECASGDDIEILPKRGDGSDGRWRWGKDRVRANLTNLVPREGAGRFDIDYKVFLNSADDEEGTVRRKPKSTWMGSEFSTDVATTLIKNIFGENPLSHSPKPLDQVLRCIELSTGKQGIVLDSFAGSGTTAHAVLAANKKDGGERKFILVECEDYADALTAERIRRVIEGYAFKGNQREELLKHSLTFTDLKKADKLLNQIASIENLESLSLSTESRRRSGTELLTVEGVKSVTDRAEGLGGHFTYCTLGEAVDIDAMLTGEHLPDLPNWARCCFTSPPVKRWIDGDRSGCAGAGLSGGIGGLPCVADLPARAGLSAHHAKRR